MLINNAIKLNINEINMILEGDNKIENSTLPNYYRVTYDSNKNIKFVRLVYDTYDVLLVFDKYKVINAISVYNTDKYIKRNGDIILHNKCANYTYVYRKIGDNNLKISVLIDGNNKVTRRIVYDIYGRLLYVINYTCNNSNLYYIYNNMNSTLSNNCFIVN